MLKYVRFLLDEEALRALEKLPEGQRSAFVRTCLKALAAGQIKWVPASPKICTPKELEEEEGEQ